LRLYPYSLWFAPTSFGLALEQERDGMKTVAVIFLAVTLAGCSMTQQASVRRSARSGMLDYSKLSRGGEGQAGERYVNSSVDWREYHKILIEPVTFWGGSGSPSGEDQQALCEYFHHALLQQFRQRFALTDRPSAGVMRLHVALVDAKAATPVLRTVSMLIPQAHVLATLKYIATGTYPFIGGAQVEARLSDAHSGKLLGEWVDHRVGGGSFAAGAQWKWGDAENAINEWAADSATRLASWTSGAAKP
jgi:hypothetical protein